MYYLSQATFGLAKLPRVWLVTGIQYITNAEVVAIRAQSKKLSTSANIPIPEPIAVATTILGGQEGVAVQVEDSNTHQNTASYHHEDERVWAAQFTQLSVQFSAEPVSVGDLPMRVPLHDLVDLKSGGIRNEDRLSERSISEESAEIFVLNEDAVSQQGEDIVNLMQDVDWTSVNKLLESVNQSEGKA
jgi:hypothetical protein